MHCCYTLVPGMTSRWHGLKPDAQGALETIYHVGDFAREQKVPYYYMERDDFAAGLREQLLANPSFQNSYQRVYSSQEVTIYQVRGLKSPASAPDPERTLIPAAGRAPAGYGAGY